MKKLVIFFLSVVMMMSVAGCNQEVNHLVTEDTSTTTDVVKDSEESSQDVTEVVDTKETSEDDRSREEVTTEAKVEKKESTTEATTEAKTEQTTERSTEEKSTEQPTTEAPKTPEEPKPDEPKPTEPEKPKPEEPKTPEVVAYDPGTVVSKAIAKCKAGGMITTTDNLNNLLEEGKITQEEYNEYYPYDGLGYYSVFVETDLNQASTTSGRKLGSVDGIADYIAGMMLLESNPIFNISYAGTYSKNGTSYYEFRCYR